MIAMRECASVARDRLYRYAQRLSVGRRSDLVKAIWHDGQGACLFTKRLERGKFIWPSVAGESVTISPAQLSYLLSGIDWRNPQETHRPTRVG
jgi:transposase